MYSFWWVAFGQGLPLLIGVTEEESLVVWYDGSLWEISATSRIGVMWRPKGFIVFPFWLNRGCCLALKMKSWAKLIGRNLILE